MALNGDTKFKEKLTGGFKNDTRSLVNFDASNQKSENSHLDRLFLSMAYKASAKKLQKSYLS